jgi:hypothetical protein
VDLVPKQPKDKFLTRDQILATPDIKPKKRKRTRSQDEELWRSLTEWRAEIGKIDIDALNAQLPDIPPREDNIAGQTRPSPPAGENPNFWLDYDRRRLWVIDHFEEGLRDREANLFRSLFRAGIGVRVEVSDLGNAQRIYETKSHMRESLKRLIHGGPHKGYTLVMPQGS